MYLKKQTEPIPEMPEGWLYPYLPDLAGKVGSRFLRTLGATWESRITGLDSYLKLQGNGRVLVTWHGNLATGIYLLRDQGFYALVSPVWEGELISQVLENMGFNLIRGSSGYNPGRSLRECLRILDRGETLILIADGPEGPRRQLKDGVISLASLSGKPVQPVFGSTVPGYILPSWDGQILTPPFARSEFRFGSPIYVPRHLNPEQKEVYKGKIVDGLTKIEKEVYLNLRTNPRFPPETRHIPKI
ncbi:DUF374 domain-containing protein [bacterium]|nr:DUF374 domain-containing protein [bacterium]